MKCKRNSDGWAIDHAALQVIRQQEIKAVCEGQPVQSVAAAFGIRVRSVFRWLADFASGGAECAVARNYFSLASRRATACRVRLVEGAALTLPLFSESHS